MDNRISPGKPIRPFFLTPPFSFLRLLAYLRSSLLRESLKKPVCVNSAYNPESEEPARPAAGWRNTRYSRIQVRATALSIFWLALALFAYMSLFWHSETNFLTYLENKYFVMSYSTWLPSPYQSRWHGPFGILWRCSVSSHPYYCLKYGGYNSLWARLIMTKF
jgi:hypothetical protein